MPRLCFVRPAWHSNYLIYLNKPDFLYPSSHSLLLFSFFISVSILFRTSHYALVNLPYLNPAYSYSILSFFLYFSSSFNIFRHFFPFVYHAFSFLFLFLFIIFPFPISTLIIISHPYLSIYLLNNTLYTEKILAEMFFFKMKLEMFYLN